MGGMKSAKQQSGISRAEWRLLLLLAAVQFTNVLDFVIVMPLAPYAKERYHITSEQFSHIVGAYGFAAFVSSLLAARYLDRFGRKVTLLTLYLGFVISTLLCGLASSYETMVLSRALAGLFGGIVGAATMATVGDVFGDHRRGTAMGVVMSSFAVASIVGLPIGLYLAEHGGVGLPFIALAGLCTVVWLAAFWIMPSLRGHINAQHANYSMWKIATAKSHLLAFAFTITIVFGAFSVAPFIADSMVANVGMQKTDMKYLYLVAGLFTLVSMNVVGRLSDRYGKVLIFRIMAFGAIIMALIVTNLPVVPLWAAIAIATLFMVMASGRMVPAQALITGSAETAIRGRFLSLNNAVQSLAMGLSSTVAGALIHQEPDGHLTGFPKVGILAGIAAIISLVLVRYLQVVKSVEVKLEEPPVVAEAVGT
jgi:predicted MFS family arabinose efflux permease